MLIKKSYTIETRIKLNKDIANYFDEYTNYYNLVYRYFWREMVKSDFTTKYPKINIFISDMCNKFNIMKRTANSIRYDVQGRIKALQELKKLELKNLNSKIISMESRIDKLKTTINISKVDVTNNRLSEKQLITYRNLKKKLYYKVLKLNKLKQNYTNLSENINKVKLSICFGTKDLFSKQYRLKQNDFKSHEGWYNTFVKNRDRNIYYLGSNDETCGNQMCQLQYSEITGKFTIRLRKEKYWEAAGKY